MASFEHNIALRQAEAVLERYKKALRRMPNISGFTVTLENGEPVIVLFVEQKPQRGELPLALDGVPIRYQITGRVEILQDRKDRIRPAIGGISVGHPRVTAGTLGAVVLIQGTWFIISNNHVIADTNEANLGDAIIQPGTFDGGTLNDTIAHLHSFESIKFWGDENLIDFAIAEVDDPKKVEDIIMGIPPAARMLPPRDYVAEPSIGMHTIGSGRTTGISLGIVEYDTVEVKIWFGPWPIGPWAWFRDQVKIIPRHNPPVVGGGDSGSVELTSDGMLLGMVFAGDRRKGAFKYVCKASNMLNWIHEEFNFRPGDYAIKENEIRWLPPVVGGFLVGGGVMGGLRHKNNLVGGRS